MARALSAVLVAGGLAACGHAQTTVTPTGSSIPATPDSSAAQVPVDTTVGQSFTTAQGNVVTVYAFESPVALAEAGFVIAAADIGACAANPASSATTTTVSAATRAAVSPRLFRVELADGTLQPSVAPFKQPALQERVLAPGECARGWVTFRVPEQIRPAFVVLRSLSAVRWKIAAA